MDLDTRNSYPSTCFPKTSEPLFPRNRVLIVGNIRMIDIQMIHSNDSLQTNESSHILFRRIRDSHLLRDLLGEGGGRGPQHDAPTTRPPNTTSALLAIASRFPQNTAGSAHTAHTIFHTRYIRYMRWMRTSHAVRASSARTTRMTRMARMARTTHTSPALQSIVHRILCLVGSHLLLGSYGIYYWSIGNPHTI
jgi:hypothetical protein